LRESQPDRSNLKLYLVLSVKRTKIKTKEKISEKKSSQDSSEIGTNTSKLDEKRDPGGG